MATSAWQCCSSSDPIISSSGVRTAAHVGNPSVSTARTTALMPAFQTDSPCRHGADFRNTGREQQVRGRGAECVRRCVPGPAGGVVAVGSLRL